MHSITRLPTLFLHRTLKSKTLVCLGMLLTMTWNTSLSSAEEDESATVDKIMGRMTLEEKVALCYGNSKFTLPGVPRLGIPELTMTDGPHSIKHDFERDSWESAGRTDDASTYLPCGSAMGATWDTELIHEYGRLLGREVRARDKDIHLAPGVNLMRRPLCGRNFEYFSEDPLLTSRIAVAYVQGVQEQGVASCVKHLIAYNDKRHPNVEMSERTLREIYLPAWEAAIHEAGALSVMGSYNLFRGQYCSHNQYLLNTVLKQELGFQGAVISDWSAVKNTFEAAFYGLDAEMGTEGVGGYDNYYMANALLERVKSGEVPMSVLDDKVRRILRIYLATRLQEDRPEGAFITQEHFDFARKAAEDSIVLLKNEASLLPLANMQGKHIAVIGDNATHIHHPDGGSSGTKALYEKTPLEGIREYFGEGVTVEYVAGYGEDLDPASAQAEAVALARQADLVIFIGGLNHEFDTELSDRKSFELPYGQAALIRALAEANPRMVTVMMTGSPVEMASWIEHTDTLLWVSYLGMEGGPALARMMGGDAEVGGRLAYTLPLRLEDAPEYVYSTYSEYHNTDYYREGVFMGYRHYDSHEIPVQFPFGYGLSYTDFEYGEARLSSSEMGGDEPLVVRIEVRNTGKRPGAEVVQLYLSDPEASVARPLKELKGFAKLHLEPGESGEAVFEIHPRDLMYFDEIAHEWVAEPGRFEALVGASVEDIRARAVFEYTDVSNGGE